MNIVCVCVYESACAHTRRWDTHYNINVIVIHYINIHSSQYNLLWEG